jgi:hypothetical protein
MLDEAVLRTAGRERPRRNATLHQAADPNGICVRGFEKPARHLNNPSHRAFSKLHAVSDVKELGSSYVAIGRAGGVRHPFG